MASQESDTPSSKWYLLRDEQRLGPYPFETLLEAVNKNTNKETDLIRCEGRGGWVPARSIPKLFSPLVTEEEVHRFLEAKFSGVVPEIRVVAEPVVPEFVVDRPIWRSKRLWTAALATIFAATLVLSITPIGLSTTFVYTIKEFAINSLTNKKEGSTNKLERALIKIPAYATLTRVDPTAQNRIRQELSEKFSGDATEDEILSRCKKHLF